MKCKVALTLIVLVYFFFTNSLFSQVGVGTTSPSAHLEVDVASDVTLPALEINPQTAPVGSAEGQLAVMGDATNGYKLYMYDDVRDKWLSVEVSTLTLGRSGNQDNVNLRATANQGNNRSGYLMPFNGTIIHATAKSNDNNGAQAKQLSIQVRNGNTTNSTTTITTAASEYIGTALNVDFSAGDYINGTIDNDGNGNINNVSVVIWVKWRQ